MKYLTFFCFFICLTVNASESDSLEMNISKFPIGTHIRTEWLGLPVLVLKPSEKQIKSIKKNTNKPSTEVIESALQSFAKFNGNKEASIFYDSTIDAYKNNSLVNPYPVIVLLGVSPTRGCAIIADYQNNYLKDPCSQSTFSFDGRAIDSNGYSEANLLVPRYSVDKGALTISSPEPIKLRDFSPNILASNLSNEAKLWDSISWDKLDVLQYLINKDKNLLETKSSVNCNLVHVASGKSSKLLTYLINNGISTTHICNNGYTPIMIALLVKNNKNAHILMKHGAKIDAYCESNVCAKPLREYLVSEAMYTQSDADELIESLLRQ